MFDNPWILLLTLLIRSTYGTHTIKLKVCFKVFIIVSRKVNHVVRNTAPTICDKRIDLWYGTEEHLELVGRCVSGRMFKWYSLWALRALACFDKRMSYHMNLRVIFKGEHQHTSLGKWYFFGLKLWGIP